MEALFKKYALLSEGKNIGSPNNTNLFEGWAGDFDDAYQATICKQNNLTIIT